MQLLRLREYSTSRGEFIILVASRGTFYLDTEFKYPSDAYSSIYYIKLKNLKNEKKLLDEKVRREFRFMLLFVGEINKKRTLMARRA